MLQDSFRMTIIRVCDWAKGETWVSGGAAERAPGSYNGQAEGAGQNVDTNEPFSSRFFGTQQ